eukprot:2300737-Amphidinium_carterae.1
MGVATAEGQGDIPGQNIFSAGFPLCTQDEVTANGEDEPEANCHTAWVDYLRHVSFCTAHKSKRLVMKQAESLPNCNHSCTLPRGCICRWE